MIQVLLTITLRGGTKFRTLEKDCKIRDQIIPEYNEAPSHVTIRNWVLKVGYYELTRPKEKADDWIILLDHSIQFGQEKIFTVLGIRQKDFLELKRPLQYTDLEPLLEKPMKTSNGELVSSEIKRLKKELGNITYATGDYASDLKKGLRLLDIPHVHDLSHLISLEIEKIFNKDERYEKLKKEMSLMRNKFSQTNVAPVVPPKQRKKSEYQSFDKIVKWADKALNLLNNTLNDADKIKELREEFNNITLDRIKEELTWIKDYKELIIELSEINIAIKDVEKDMKYNGLSLTTLKNAEISLRKLKSGNSITLKDNILRKLHEQFNLLPDKDNILCSSDILESTFGKYKNRVSENPMASVTNLMLIIAAFTCSLTEERVKECIENVKISDIKIWSEDKIGISLHKQRNLLFSI
ncbi:MAG: hypothetical protein K8R58_14210 [Bacteroidales bacterium]|nr:hypothetical protein [Bacteroidales bacterium]